MIETFSAPIWLVRIFDAARSTAILRSAIELDVFSKLDGKRSEPAAVAAEIGCPVRGTTMLLRALVALDLLDEKEGRFSLTAAAETYLVPGKPEYVGGFAAIVCNQNVWNGLGRLTDAIRNDGTILTQHAETPENPFWQTFAHSGEAMAFPAGLAIERALHGWIAEKPRARV